MKNIKVELTNDFHQTSIVVIVPAIVAGPDDGDRQDRVWYWIQSERQSHNSADRARCMRLYNRIQNRLCGCSGCSCGIVR